jgi:hypothetical protein
MSSTSDNNIPGPALSASTPLIDPGLRFAFLSLHAVEVCWPRTSFTGDQYLPRTRNSPRRPGPAHLVTRQSPKSSSSPSNIASASAPPRRTPPCRHARPDRTCPLVGTHLQPTRNRLAGAVTRRPAHRAPARGGDVAELGTARSTVQAWHESDILELTAHCHPRTLRQLRWANTILKTQSPQLLTNPLNIPVAPDRGVTQRRRNDGSQKR